MLCRLSEPLARCVQDLEYDMGGREGLGSAPVGPIRLAKDAQAELIARIAEVDVRPLAAERDVLRLLVGLGDAVDDAVPWQPPYLRDALIALPAVRAALRDAAEAIAHSPAAAWWGDPIDLGGQFEMRAPDDREAATALPARDALAELSEGQRLWEGLPRQRPADPAQESSDEWWSFPWAWLPPKIAVRMPSSSRRLPEIGAVELAAQEDSHGQERVRLWQIHPAAADVRVFEIHGPGDWARLVSTHPFDVTRSRRGVWWQSTGIDEPWFVADWQGVAREWDAVHVSVRGYLTTAGEPVPVPGGHTVLAGWNPDCTYWLCDVTKTRAEEWIRIGDEDTAHWRTAPDDSNRR